MWATQLQHDPTISTVASAHRATWLSGATTWHVQVSDTDHGIRIGAEGLALNLSVLPVDVDRLPAIEEEYVRGDEWHLWMPQQTQDLISLKLALRTLHCDEDRWIVEATFSIQTLLLDTHPTIDLLVTGRKQPSTAPVQGCSPMTCIDMTEGGQIAILLAPTDAPFTSDKSTASEVRLRLFGEFLEKGVIRKARPWIVFNRKSEGCNSAELKALLERLEQSPPPLTP